MFFPGASSPVVGVTSFDSMAVGRPTLGHVLTPRAAQRPAKIHARRRQQDRACAHHLQGAEGMGEGYPVDQDGDNRIDERQRPDQRRGDFWMALYNRVDISPVWTTPIMIR